MDVNHGRHLNWDAALFAVNFCDEIACFAATFALFVEEYVRSRRNDGGRQGQLAGTANTAALDEAGRGM